MFRLVLTRTISLAGNCCHLPHPSWGRNMLKNIKKVRLLVRSTFLSKENHAIGPTLSWIRNALKCENCAQFPTKLSLIVIRGFISSKQTFSPQNFEMFWKYPSDKSQFLRLGNDSCWYLFQSISRSLGAYLWELINEIFFWENDLIEFFL